MGPTEGQDTFEDENKFCAPMNIDPPAHILALLTHFLPSYNAQNIVKQGTISVIVHSLTQCYVSHLFRKTIFLATLRTLTQ
jgi:hypothetical protein